MPPFVFLSSGLFLGWSLGAQDASNVFGSAVQTRMVQFKTAALIASVFITLGAVVGGAGTAHTLGSLGAVNAIGGAFVTSLSAALCVYWMIKAKLPVSVSQAVVGAIIGWNFFSNSVTDVASIVKIATTWIACPLLAACVSMPIYLMVRFVLKKAKIHLLRLDAYTRFAMVLAGAFGSYSLGANNMANVVGVFVSVSPFTDIHLGSFVFTGIQQLFLMGGLAASIGVCSYSKRTMMAVGRGLPSLSPITAWVVLVSHSLVLFLFSSEPLEYFLASRGFPTLPLVPVSSTQAVIGAVLGIALLRDIKNIRVKPLLRIMSGWVMTPVIAATIAFFSLFIVQNVFTQPVYREVHYQMNDAVLERAKRAGIPTEKLFLLKGRDYASAVDFREAVRERVALPATEENGLIRLSRLENIQVTSERLMSEVKPGMFTEEQYEDIRRLLGRRFQYRFELEEALAEQGPQWRLLPSSKMNKLLNKRTKERVDLVEYIFQVN